MAKRNITTRRDVRSLAFHLLYAADRLEYSVPFQEIVEDFRSGYDLEITDDSLAIQMAQDVVERREELDEQIKPYLKNWKLERLGCCTRLILRMALWELQQLDAIPSVIINEAIELAKSFAEKDAYKFINGILDEMCEKLELTNGEK
jgi:transcription antitermination protein NusB